MGLDMGGRYVSIPMDEYIDSQKELQYLQFFFEECDMSPDHGDVVNIINEQ